MYQSPGTFLNPSLRILKCAISGASPLRAEARGSQHRHGNVSIDKLGKKEKIPRARRESQDVRFCVVRGHARANELDSGRPIASTDIRELVCARRHAHDVSHERACAGRAQQKVPTQETDEEVLLRR